MKKQISFSTIGNKYLHQMRDKINNSEDKVDLGNHFSYTVTQFLNEVFDNDEVDIASDAVIFDPNSQNYYTINEDLKKIKIFKETWENSDLPNVIKKFADSTYHRYIHLNKHAEKTQKKIRN